MRKTNCQAEFHGQAKVTDWRSCQEKSIWTPERTDHYKRLDIRCLLTGKMFQQEFSREAGSSTLNLRDGREREFL